MSIFLSKNGWLILVWLLMHDYAPNVVTRSGSLFEHSSMLPQHLLRISWMMGTVLACSYMVRGYPEYFQDTEECSGSQFLGELSKATLNINDALGSLEHLPRLFPAKSQIVLVSPLLPNIYPWYLICVLMDMLWSLSALIRLRNDMCLLNNFSGHSL